MAEITKHICDYCGGDFTAAPSVTERYILQGNRYADAAGSMDSNRKILEMHDPCWRRFAKQCGDKADEVEANHDN